MAAIIKYDPNSATVPNRVLEHRKSVQESDWLSVPNVLITDSGDFPEVAALIADQVPMSQWKVANGLVAALSQADLDALAAQLAIDAAAAAVANLAASKAYAKGQLVNQKELRDAVLAVLDVIVPEINTLRAQHSLAARTQNQVVTAMKNAYGSRIDSWV